MPAHACVQPTSIVINIPTPIKLFFNNCNYQIEVDYNTFLTDFIEDKHKQIRTDI